MTRDPFIDRPERDATPKYIQELSQQLAVYVGRLILNVYDGVSKNIGVGNPDQIAKKPPLRKASGGHIPSHDCCAFHEDFAVYAQGGLQYYDNRMLAKGFLDGLKDLGKKLTGIVGRRNSRLDESPFKIGQKKIYKADGEPMSQQEWREFENKVTNYMSPYLDNVTEEMAVKGMLLGLASAEAEMQGKRVEQYGKQSYKQIERERFQGYVPDSFQSLEDRVEVTKDMEKSLMLSYNDAANYVTQVDENVRGAIRQQVVAAHRLGKSPTELASDLYWMKDENPELRKYTAENLLRDWQRVAYTEIKTIESKSKMAATESQARKSIDDPSKAVYVVFTGQGRCPVCKKYIGTIARHIPLELVGDPLDDSLKSRGINDPHTDIAVWQGKNNVGLPQRQWRLCTPVHPWCNDSLARFFPDEQEYDHETNRIQFKHGKEFEEHIPDDWFEMIENEKAQKRLREEQIRKQRMEGV